MKAIGLAIAGYFFFTVMDLSVKWLLQSHSLFQVTFHISFFALVGLLVWIAPNFSLLKTKHPKIHFIRAFLVLVADLLAFYSYGEIPIAEAYALILTMPIFTVIISIMLGYEEARFRRILFSLIGFSGIFLVLTPDFGSFEIAMIAALGCAVIESVSFLMVTHNKDKEPPQVFAFYGLALLVLVSGILSFSNYQVMTTESWIISVIGGAFYATGSMCVVSAFHSGSPGVVSSIQYGQLLWGMLLGFLIWRDIPTTLSILGGVIIVLAGLMITFSSKTQEKT